MKIRQDRPPSRAQHSDEYLAYLASPEWAATRAAALVRAKHRCQAPGCGATRNLEVHHLSYDNLGAEPWGALEVLCPACHADADRRRHGARRGR